MISGAEAAWHIYPELDLNFKGPNTKKVLELKLQIHPIGKCTHFFKCHPRSTISIHENR